MRITVVGIGYVGLVVGVCLADFGNEVVCVDINKEKINKLKKGIIPIYEEGLSDMLDRNLKEKRISFTTNIKEGVEHAEVLFIAVGTPPDKNHHADLSAVKEVAKNIGRYMKNYLVVVNKSTVPVGTAQLVEKIIKQNQKKPIRFDVVSNPEFLREGTAVKDFTNPDRIIIGTSSKKAREIMETLYRGVVRADRPILFTDTKSAEIIKYASNAMLATRISFMNEVAALCEKVGADVTVVAKGMGLDRRIGPRFLQAGLGYGGSCFPKDVKALAQTMNGHDIESKILTAVEEVNENQKRSAIPKVKRLVGDINGKTIAIWGLAFKPKTDDMREAPSIVIINELQKLGAKIKAFDPEAVEVAKKILNNVTYCDNPYSALKGADCLVVVTEWNEFRYLDKEKMKKLMKSPNVVDGRNIYDPDEMRRLGFNYIGVGRG